MFQISWDMHLLKRFLGSLHIVKASLVCQTVGKSSCDGLIVFDVVLKRT
jgi:hypothetical protein